MSRRKIREIIFRLLFMSEFHTCEELDSQTELFFREIREEYPEFAEEDYISGKFRGILEHLPRIDEKLDTQMRSWSMDRIGKVELSILRLAAYEILFDEAVPPRVAINEAVELAKKYAEEEAFGFVNAVLGGLYRREIETESESEGEEENPGPKAAAEPGEKPGETAETEPGTGTKSPELNESQNSREAVGALSGRGKMSRLPVFDSGDKKVIIVQNEKKNQKKK